MKKYFILVAFCLLFLFPFNAIATEDDADGVVITFAQEIEYTQEVPEPPEWEPDPPETPEPETFKALDLNGLNIVPTDANGGYVRVEITLAEIPLRILTWGVIRDGYQQIIVELPDNLLPGTYQLKVDNDQGVSDRDVTIGAVGETGAQGIQGVAGADGTDGVNGADGATGATGATGDSYIKAWVNFNGFNPLTIRDSFNISSISRTGTGYYKITFSTPFSNANYVMVAASSHGQTYISPTQVFSSNITIYHLNTSGQNTDSEFVMLTFLGN